ncbi:MAG: hypothetical protein JWM72_1608 [Actinomycetia bacterium]|nr:hypothetical protein [Actinomycetes bacterium]
MQQWEYIFIFQLGGGWQFAGAESGNAPDVINLLNELGSRGWELASILSHDRDTQQYYMKRQSN